MRNLIYAKPEGPVSLIQARTYHINYLKSPNGPHVKDNSKDIIHCLRMSQTDLLQLAANAGGGLRIYFCRHNENEDALNLVVVPVDALGDNVLSYIDSNGMSQTTLVNTLEPCPTQCPQTNGQTSHAHSFSPKDLNYVVNERNEPVWCKPNRKEEDGNNTHIWFKQDRTPVEPPDLTISKLGETN